MYLQGRYDLTIIGHNGDHSPIGCLNAQVWVNPGSYIDAKNNLYPQITSKIH